MLLIYYQKRLNCAVCFIPVPMILGKGVNCLFSRMLTLHPFPISLPTSS